MSTTDHTATASQVFLNNDPSPLEMDADTFYGLGMHAVELAAEYLEGIPQKLVYQPMTPAERHLLLYQPLPEYGRIARSPLRFL